MHHNYKTVQPREYNRFKYSCNEINELKKQCKFTPVAMEVYAQELRILKQKIIDAYNTSVFPIGALLEEAKEHGWEGKALENMHDVDHEIMRQTKVLYATIIAALGTEEEPIKTRYRYAGMTTEEALAKEKCSYDMEEIKKKWDELYATKKQYREKYESNRTIQQDI